MEEKRISGEESFAIIQQMIKVARDEHRETGHGWLIWGWLLFISSILSIVLVQLNLIRYISWMWIIMLFVGLLVYVMGLFRYRKRNTVKTYVQGLLDKLETGFFISLFAIIAGGYLQHRGTVSFGYFYILYAFWMYIHGTAIRFRPLLIGAFVNWSAALAIFLLEDFRYDMTISAIAILVGYLIPGYMLRAEYKKNQIIQESGQHGI